MPDLSLQFSGRRVLVTGASQGIGQAVALAFASHGAQVCVVARRPDRLKAVVDAMGGAAKGHGWKACDLMNAEDATVTVRSLQETLGPFDIVIHSLGGSQGLRDIFAGSGDWQRIWRLNLGSVIDVNNTVVPAMVERGWGRVVMFSSRAATALDGAPAYCSAKAALHAYIGLLGRALASSGVIACGLMPGAFAAEGNSWDRAMEQNPAQVQEFVRRHISLGRVGNAADIIPFVLFLASEHNTFGAGTIVPLDGGAV